MVEKRRILDSVILAGTGIALMGWAQNTKIDEPISQVPESPPPAVLITPDIPLPYQWIIPSGWKFDVSSPIGEFTLGYKVPEEDKMCFDWPVSGAISTYFDYEFINDSQYYELYGLNPIGHFAIDIDQYGNFGGPVVAPADATVLEADLGENEKWAYGNYLILDFGEGWKGLLLHNSELLVEAEQKVERGSVIAKVGSTGNSSGPHVHFELSHNDLLVDPLLFLDPNSLTCDSN